MRMNRFIMIGGLVAVVFLGLVIIWWLQNDLLVTNNDEVNSMVVEEQFVTVEPIPSFLNSMKDLDNLYEEGMDLIVLILSKDLAHGDVKYEGKIDLSSFRVASPDTVPSRISFMTGLFPKLVLKSTDGPTPLGLFVNLFQLLRDHGVKIGHFGEWDFTEDIRSVTDTSLVTRNPREALSSATAFSERCIDAHQRCYINVWLPQTDVAFEHYGKRERRWTYGEPGVSPKSQNCRDILRFPHHEARYKTCPKQIHRASRHKEEKLVEKFRRRIANVTTSTYKSIIVATSTNGPESPQIYGHAHPQTMHRGGKRSLYDGGILVPFRAAISFHDPRRDEIYYNFTSSFRNPFRLVGSVDWPSTVAGFFRLPRNDALDGIDVSRYIFGIEEEQTDRERKPLVWEWRFSVPGHCTHEAPRFAAMRDAKFKFLTSTPETLVKEGKLYGELYEVVSDDTLGNQTWIFERNNQMLIDGNHKVASELHATIEKHFQFASEKEEKHQRCGCKEIHDALKKDRKILSKEQESEIIKGKEIPQGILLLVSDDLGIGDISLYNQNRQSKHLDSIQETVAFEADTPFIDQLGREGLVLTNFYANAAICSPTRASIMTGRYPFHKDVGMHFQAQNSLKKSELYGVVPYLGFENSEESMFLTAILRKNGFKVGHFGKWHLGDMPSDLRDDVTGRNLSRPVWDDSYGLSDFQVYSSTIMPKFQWNETWIDRHYLEHDDLCFAAHVQHDIVSRTIEFITKRVARKEKFFVNVWFQNSHAPLNLASDYDQAKAMGYPFAKNPFPGRERQRGNGKKGGFYPNKGIDPHLSLQIYRSLVKDHDREIGRLMQFLSKQQLDDKVVVIYTSDNGPEYSTMYHASVGSANPFRGGKRSLFEGGLRMPFIMRWKGVIPPQSMKHQLASTIDILPTILEMARINSAISSHVFDGESIFASSSNSNKNEKAILFEFRGWAQGGDCSVYSGRFAIRYKQFKLHFEPKNPTHVTPKKFDILGLYDVENDPSEMDNLLKPKQDDSSSSTSALVEKMVGKWITYFESGRYDQKYIPSSTIQVKRRQSLLQCQQLLKQGASFIIGEQFKWNRSTKLDRNNLLLP